MTVRLHSAQPDNPFVLADIDLARLSGMRSQTAGPGSEDVPQAAATPSARRGGLANRDAAIDRAIREAVAPLVDAGAGRVSIEVRNAHVTLGGRVPSARLRDSIGHAAAQCANVGGVDNRIAVVPGDAASVVLTPERRTVTMKPDGRRGASRGPTGAR